MNQLISSTEDSPEQLEHLRQFGMLILGDTRLGDHLNSQVISLLVKFLDDKKDYKFQLYSAVALEHTVSSKFGSEFKDTSVPYLVNLISSPDLPVQTQALYTLITIAKAYPESCNAMIQNKALDLLVSILTEKSNHFELLEYAGGLLAVFCQISPHLLSDKMHKVIGTISTAIQYRQSWSVIVNVSLALSILSDKKLVEIGTAVIRLLELINHREYFVFISALRTIGNYVRWGSDEDIQEVIDMGWIDALIRLVRTDKFEVKEVAARAISNIVSGSNKKQFMYLENNCFPVLDDLRFFHCRDNQRIVTLCSNILQLDNIRARMASGSTTDHASAEYARQVEKITRKKNSRRCKNSKG
ncbi:hypothetical protein AgCh_033549 [Apium graveolens]